MVSGIHEVVVPKLTSGGMYAMLVAVAVVDMVPKIQVVSMIRREQRRGVLIKGRRIPAGRLRRITGTPGVSIGPT